MSDRSGRWDVVVVGAGPAGSAVAARLAVFGHDVLVLDRAEFPRRKPCGECVNPAAVAALARLGALNAVLATGPASLHGWDISGSAQARFTGHFPEGTAGFALPRLVLDAVLLDHARSRGAQVRLGARVTHLLRDGAQVTGVRIRDEVTGELNDVRARLVIGADGLRSVVSRRLGALRRPPLLRKVALTAHLRGIPSIEGHGELRTARGECLGIADVGDGTTNVTYVLAGARVPEARGDAAACFDAAVARYGFTDAARVDDVLSTGPFDWPIRSAIAPGALLVGDAAGYYDPFTGQGIFRALHGAELAASVADAALREGDVTLEALAPYEALRRAAFGPGERMQRLVEAVVSRPRWFGAAARRLAARPRLADALVAVTGDLAGPASLLRPRLLLDLLG